MKFDNNFIVNDILEVSQYKVTVMKVKFLISEGHVETLSDHLRLPQRCSVSARGCKTFDTTYVWIPPRSTCDLEEVRTVSMKPENGYLVDRENKVLLKLGTSLPSPSGCPTALLYATEYKDLYLTGPGKNWPRMENDADIATFVRARDDYILFETEKLAANQDVKIKTQICRESLNE